MRVLTQCQDWERMGRTVGIYRWMDFWESIIRDDSGDNGRRWCEDDCLRGRKVGWCREIGDGIVGESCCRVWCVM